jgi:hypothetical protein
LKAHVDLALQVVGALAGSGVPADDGGERQDDHSERKHDLSHA